MYYVYALDIGHEFACVTGVPTRQYWYMYEGVGSRVSAHATSLHGMSWATHVANVLARIGNVEDYIPWEIWVGSVACEP